MTVAWGGASSSDHLRALDANAVYLHARGVNLHVAYFHALGIVDRISLGVVAVEVEEDTQEAATEE